MGFRLNTQKNYRIIHITPKSISSDFDSFNFITATFIYKYFLDHLILEID